MVEDARERGNPPPQDVNTPPLDCWCEQDCHTEWEGVWHLLVSELKIPELTEWLDRQIRRFRSR